MMRHDVSLKWTISIVAACIALHCADLGPVAGTVTQSGNGIVSGLVVDSGVPVFGARVLLVPAQYDPNSGTPLPDSLSYTTGPSGAFHITAPGSHVYNVEVLHGSGKNALRFGIGLSTGDSQSTGPLKLAFPGTIKVIIPEILGETYAYAYIPGTTFYSSMSGDTAILGYIPAGTIPELSYHPAAAGAKDRVVQTNIPVASGQTTVIADYSTWAYSKRLYLNTTPSGAAIAGNVLDFPALVRLTSSTFDFSRALSGGADVRFTKSNGMPLPFEIERWDAASQAAEIWMKLDTVYGNDSSHFFTMWWGNPNAVSASDGEAVFDTAGGFLCDVPPL